jgi:polar amino acid transport system ATP-binding protein
MKLKLINLHKAFGANKILNGISLDVDQGEMICLIGESGSG